MGAVLFTSHRPLERAENIKAVYDAYDGEKYFSRLSQYRQIEDLQSGKYALQVTDELPSATVGKCLFIGHGMGACKTYGLDQPHAYFKRPDLITCAIASSEEMKPIVAKQCGISLSQVVTLGMPRTDAYFNKDHLETEKKVYLYAPTFRNYKYWQPNFGHLSECLGENETLIVKPHMVTGRMMRKSWKNVIEIDSRIPTTDFLVQADVLVTDYSSIMFDAFVMRKPVVLFAKDRRRYLRTRGMYFPYPRYYGDFYCDDEQVLAQMLQKAEWTEKAEELRAFYAGACDGRSTERCIKLIRSMA